MLGYDSVNVVAVATFPEESLVSIFILDGGSRLLWSNCNLPRSCTVSQPIS